MKFCETKKILNQLVADLSVFSVRIHQVHWYMHGGRFLSLHPKMDELMDQINDQLDEISERLITLDGSPYSTLEEFFVNSKLKEEKGSWNMTIDKQINYLLEGYSYLISIYEEGIEIAGKEGDNCTEDIFIGSKADLEKVIWMLKAELGSSAALDK
ncbi:MULTISPECIES: Dps family protein [Enterococcus]|nr:MULTISPECIES: DNA starvation/stationary phase protection protein [Enterococcus]EGO2585325.1 DNA starvation/stationary phase protection protein [Enterococcus faecalis]EGO2590840.1 DNA starvation/stationary phase protection protein [Enterococcus faecalis]EGO2665811.1 DNA starvation/stationary phase protection protein [Enterococcus faecalis]EGO2815897.1 DNA starvation/stationary phase protection protein [Enterococcus faecalis]EGO2834807.1 DNA starvation/stationary phase protection protein [Ent